MLKKTFILLSFFAAFFVFANDEKSDANEMAAQNIFAKLLSPDALKNVWDFFHNDNKSNTQRPLSEVLKADGTLSDGLQGSFDAKGFSVMGSVNGKPVFKPQGLINTGINAWDKSLSTTLGISVAKTVAYYNGFLYVGGSYGLYRWETDKWVPIMTLTSSSEVYITIIFDNKLYLGGGFTNANGLANGNYIAVWDGSTISTVGTGLNGNVNALAVIGTDLYAGGTFTAAGGNSSASRIAKWNGTSWSALASGLNAVVYALASTGTDLYVGGGFTDAGGNAAADRIAKWNGTAWSALDTGIGNNTVRALAVTPDGLYVGGDFTDAGGNTAADRLAYFSNGTWSAILTGLNNTVFSLLVSNTDLYVGGSFTDAGGNAQADYIAKWNGTSWSSFGTGLDNTVYTIILNNNDIYIAGNFIDNVYNVNKVAKWDGSTWLQYGSGITNTINCIAVAGTDVYLGGSFTNAFDISNADRIVKFNGTSWSALGTGIANGIVYTLAVNGTNLYVGGSFTEAGGSPNTSRIANWDGSTWSSLATGINNGIVRSFAIINTDLYVGGSFTDAGDNANADRIAKWDGTAWSALVTGVVGATSPASSTVNALAVIGSDLYVGGRFDNAGGNTYADAIAKWDGLAWSSLGTGLSETNLPIVNALAVVGTKLYVGGSFSDVDYNYNAKNIAVWNGSTWSALASGLSSSVATLTVSGNNVYAGGNFTNGIAKWNGSSWSAVGAGTFDGTVNAIALYGTDIYMGGGFQKLNGDMVSKFAVYHTQWYWSGNTNTDWNTTSNWKYNTIPATGDDVIIPATSVTNEPTISTTVNLKNLTIASNRTLTLNANLTVTDSAVFYSNAAGTARLGSGTGSITGTVVAKKYIAGGKRAWRFLSHPFTTASAVKLSQYADDIDITGPGGTANGFATNISTGYGAYYYNTNIGNESLANDPGWKGVDSANTTINSGDGIRVFIRGAKGQASIYQSPYPTPQTATISVTGGLNPSGDYTKTLVKSANSGYNFVGNPYVSAVDITAITRTAGVNTNTWVWSARLGTSGGYLTYTNGSGYALPSMGAVIVQTTTTGQSLTFTEANKTTVDTSTMLRQYAQKDMLEMTVNADGNMFDRFTMFFNKKGSTAGTDAIFDAAKFRNAEVNLYSLNNDQKALAVDMRPYNNDAIIPLGFTSNKSKTYTLKVENLNLDGSENYLFLTDKYLDTQIKLEPGTEYQFTVDANTASQGDNRFELTQIPRPIRRSNTVTLTLYPNPTTDIVSIKCDGLNEKENTIISVVDVNGKIVKSINVGKRSIINQTITTKAFASGVYVVEVVNGSSKQSQHIIKQ